MNKSKLGTFVYFGLMAGFFFLLVYALILDCMREDKIVRMEDVQAELYEVVTLDVVGDKSTVIGPVDCKTFKDEGTTILIPRKPGTYIVIVSKRTRQGTTIYITKVECGAGETPDIVPDPPVNPDEPVTPDVSTFQKRFKELLISSVPEAHRAGVCPKLAEACAKVRSANYASEEELLEAIQTAQRAALDWDNASVEFRASWFSLFQGNGPFDKLLSEEYPDKVNWNKVLSDMEQVYKSL